MGQYYRSFIINEKEEVVFSPLDSGCGSKLTEHSWVGNRFCNGVMEYIENNPSMVAWVGDYADDEDDFGDRYTRHDYETVWGDGDDNDRMFDSEPEVHTDGYIVNRSTGQYVDLAKYVMRSEDSDWCVHPLPLLTAIGNGRGGGDYRGYNDYQVGAWAMDMIEYTHEKPEHYHEVLTMFDPYA